MNFRIRTNVVVDSQCPASTVNDQLTVLLREGGNQPMLRFHRDTKVTLTCIHSLTELFTQPSRHSYHVCVLCV